VGLLPRVCLVSPGWRSTPPLSKRPPLKLTVAPEGPPESRDAQPHHTGSWSEVVGGASIASDLVVCAAILGLSVPFFTD